MNNPKNRKNYCIVFILIICVILPFALIRLQEESYSKKQPTVTNGVLDLRKWDFERDGLISLDGEWEFYWNKILTYNDFHHTSETIAPDAYVSVPSTWNSYKLNGKQPTGEGCATYRLRIMSMDSETLKALKIQNVSTAYRFMVDNEIVASNGIVSNNPEETRAEFNPQAVMFKNASGDYEIIIQVSNYTYARGGLWYSIYLGTNQQIQNMVSKASNREMFILGGILMLMLYHLAIFIFQRKNISIIYHVMLMIIIAARIPVTGEYLISDIFHHISIRPLVAIEYLTICWAPIAWLLFLNRFYPQEISSKVVNIATFSGVLLTIFTVLSPVYIFTAALPVYELMFLVYFVYAIKCFAVAIFRKREGVVIMLLATVAFIATFVNDALYQWNIISSRTGGVFGFSAFVIIFIQAYILASQFSKTYDEMAQLSDKLLSLDKLKDEFLANTSHELRTPLNGIINITDSLINSGDETLNPDLRYNLQVVVEAARRLHGLINDILDISSLKNGEIRLNIEPIDLHSIVSLTFYELGRSNNGKDVELINNISEDFPPVDADLERVRQIFYNIIGNAIKFTNKGYIEAGALIRQGQAEIWVADTGCGIPNDKLDDIFMPFYQVDSKTTRETGGTGLGLSITKKLLELHQGSIQVTSEEGCGTRFVFTLPLSKMQETDTFVKNFENEPMVESITTILMPPERQENQKYSILVADDDYTNLRAISLILNSEGYYTKTVTDGQQVLNELSRQPNYDLIILDIMMPKLSGYQVLEEIRKRFSELELPVILLTAKTRQPDIQAGFKAGANDYIAKPFETEELKSRVSTLVRLKKSVNSIVTAELNFLQAQIKPHFLYNALSVIASLSVREPKRAKELLLNLSNYLRGSFNFENHSGLVTLSTELQTVEAYLAIEKARFKERLHVEYVVPKDISVSVPMLSLQPLVENAVQHGILKRVDGGTLRLSVAAEDEQVVITVEDDGVGMTPDKLDGLFSPGEDHGVGIQNINRRMQTMYGYGLSIESAPDKGTKVIVRVPLN